MQSHNGNIHITEEIFKTKCNVFFYFKLTVGKKWYLLFESKLSWMIRANTLNYNISTCITANGDFFSIELILINIKLL